jgi:hypothetical protein
MRLPNPVYESLPAIYMLAGALLLFASYRLHTGTVSVLAMIAGGIGLIGGIAVWLRRRDFRATDAEYWSQQPPGQSDEDLR